MKLKEIKWVRVGRLFGNFQTKSLAYKTESSISYLRILENDKEIPIVLSGFSISRRQIFRSIEGQLGKKIYQYHCQESASFEADIRNSASRNHFKERSAESQRALDLLSTHNTIEALTEIAAYAISEKTEPHRTSKSKNQKKDYQKDPSYLKLLRLQKRLAKVATQPNSLFEIDDLTLHQIAKSQYLLKFVPGYKRHLNSLVGGQKKITAKKMESNVKGLIVRVEAITRRDPQLLENMCIAVDHDFRQLFSDKKVVVELQATAESNAGLESNSIEMMDLVKAFVNDLEENEIPLVRGYRSISKMIRDHRNEHSAYIFTTYRRDKRKARKNL